jgi:drug/metabolite transporter (DMT)-like permease
VKRATLKTIAHFHLKWMALPGNVRGGAWVVLGALVGAVTQAMVKILAVNIHPFELTFFRNVIGLFMVLPLVMRAGVSGFKTGKLSFQIIRGVASSIGLCLWFIAVQKIPLANAVALNFTKPLFQIVLSIVILHEVVRWRRGSATIVGFCGALIVVRPGGSDFDWASLYALGAAGCFAVTQTFVKLMAATEKPQTIMLYFSLVGIPVMLVPAMWVWTWPTGWEWVLLIAMGALATLGQTFWILGLRAGELTAVGPFEYTQLIWAGLLGYFLFQELPGVWSWVGAAVIVGSALYMARREAMLARQGRLGEVRENSPRQRRRA